MLRIYMHIEFDKCSMITLLVKRMWSIKRVWTSYMFSQTWKETTALLETYPVHGIQNKHSNAVHLISLKGTYFLVQLKLPQSTILR